MARSSVRATRCPLPRDAGHDKLAAMSKGNTSSNGESEACASYFTRANLIYFSFALHAQGRRIPPLIAEIIRGACRDTSTVSSVASLDANLILGIIQAITSGGGKISGGKISSVASLDADLILGIIQAITGGS
jgi:hypothetical protein